MRTAPFILSFLWLVAVSPATLFAESREAAARIKILQARFEFLLSEADKPLAELQEKYVVALDRLSGKRQAAGDLEGILAIKKEKERIQTGTQPFDPVDEEIANLHATYEREHARIKLSLRDAEIKVYEAHEAQLLNAKTQFTKDGDLEGAIAAKEAASKVRATIDELKGSATAKSPLTDSSPLTPGGTGADTGSGDEVLWSLIDGGKYKLGNNLTADKSDSRFVLKHTIQKGATFLTTTESFSPPYRIRARASTDSTNLRFSFGPQGIVIFNWEMNLDALRLHHYDTGKITAVNGKGELRVDRMHDIEIDVTPSGIVVKANRRKVGETKSPVTDNEAPVGIGAAFGSVITVEQFEVVKLEDQ